MNRREALRWAGVLAAGLTGHWTIERLVRSEHNVRHYGALGDGRSNDSAAFTAAIEATAASGGIVLVPSSTAPYVGSGISVRSSVSIRFGTGAVLRAPPDLPSHQVILRMHDVQDVELMGGVIDGSGSRQDQGEWRHGISIRGASRVAIRGTRAVNCAGDGFYIGATERQPYSADIRLEDCHADRNRRQGISLVSGRRVTLVRPWLTNTAGTAPAAGLDIEPNGPDEAVEEVRVLSPYTAGNSGGGILLALHNLDETSSPVDIEIRDHLSVDDLIGCRTTYMPRRVKGSIRIDRPRYIRSGEHGFLARDWGIDGPRITLTQPLVIDPNSSGTRSERFGSAIALYKLRSYGRYPEVIGNLEIVAPEVRDTREEPRVTYAFYLRNEVDESAIGKVRIVSPRPLTGVARGREAFIRGPVEVVDTYSVLDG